MSLSLRPFTKRDIAQLKSWFPTERDCLQWAGAGLRFPIIDGDLKAIIRDHAWPNPDREIWALQSRAQTVGHAQISYNTRLRQATLGRVAIAPDQRGKSYAKPLMKLAVRQAFSYRWVHRIELRVYDFNSPAIAAYSGIGFVHEGTRRQSTPIGSEFWNTNVMSLLRPEYDRFDKRTERE